ncbi:MAG TPA: ATP-binding protein [Burkholderiales bacterium]|nr:ATP-binding protein [Burkholderiales bacterium]
MMPRSLLWRAFLLIAVVIVLAIGAWVQIFRAYDVEPRTRQVAQMVVSVVNLTRTALVTAQPELRRELLVELVEREGIRIYPAEATDEIEELPHDRPQLQLLANEIRRDLGPQTRIARILNGERGFWVSFYIGEDEYWVMLPRERVERQLALQWVGWGALVLVLALIAAYFIVFRLREPVAALTRAARDIGHGRTPPPLDDEDGPEELRTVSRAFNQMSRNLAQLEEDRALILAGVSHDLRTPLARLRLGLEMSGVDEESLQAMSADIEEMDRIIGQFLDFARAAGGEEDAATDVGALADDLARHYRHTGHTLDAQIDDTGELAVKPMAIRRAISNLLDNAFRYGNGDVALRVRTTDREVSIEVLDRGPGIPIEDAERMKQPFTRLETARSGKGGSGLGLAIVDRIARMHGGRFELLQREGGGLIAQVILPRA